MTFDEEGYKKTAFADHFERYYFCELSDELFNAQETFQLAKSAIQGSIIWKMMLFKTVIDNLSKIAQIQSTLASQLRS